MDYEVVFEITLRGLGITTSAFIGLVLIAFGLLIYIYPNILYMFPYQQSNRWSEKRIRTFLVFWLAFAVLWTATTFFVTYSKQKVFREAYANGEYEVTEGIVSNFDPMPRSGHKMESFTVSGTKFEYSDFVVTPGFNNATSRGGPIHDGLPVRISHVGNVILKLEVSKDN